MLRAPAQGPRGEGLGADRGEPAPLRPDARTPLLGAQRTLAPQSAVADCACAASASATPVTVKTTGILALATTFTLTLPNACYLH